MGMDNDAADLLADISQGDAMAFSSLYRQYRGAMYAVAIQILHNHEDAEDCVQDSFMKVWNKADKYQKSLAQGSTWLMAVARNRAIDKLRSRQRRTKLYDSFEEHSTRMEAGSDEAPEKATWKADWDGLQREALALIDTLPEAQSSAIRNCFLAGFTHSEEAARLNVPLGTVKARCRRGISHIKRLLTA